MAKATNDARIKALEDKLATLVSLVEDVAKKLPSAEEPKAEAPKAETAAPAVNQYPIPSDYVQLVRSTLNQEFGINLIPESDRPMFQFHIIVPDKYSTLGPEQKKMLGADIRNKVISYADGVNGVKQFVELVFSSFAPERRAQILADRK